MGEIGEFSFFGKVLVGRLLKEKSNATKRRRRGKRKKLNFFFFIRTKEFVIFLNEDKAGKKIKEKILSLWEKEKCMGWLGQVK